MVSALELEARTLVELSNQEQGTYGGTFFEKLAKIRSESSSVFDGFVRSNVDLVFTVTGAATIGIMSAAGVVGLPVIITAGAFFTGRPATTVSYHDRKRQQHN